MKKTIFITGSTDGIGKLTAIRLAKEGNDIILHGRSQEKLSAVIAEVQAVSANSKVSGYVADLADLKAVKAMANRINEEVAELDVLVNNAGVFNSPAPNNGDGLDLRMVVNYVAPYVLTHALLPLLEKSESARIINLSSAAQAPVSKEVLWGKASLPTSATYAQSKLALTMWSFYLANQLKDVSVIALNPGSLLNTRMVQEAYGTFWAPADKGANIIYDLAQSDKYKDATGQYFDNDKGSFGPAHADAYDEKKIGLLIEQTQALLAELGY